MVSVCTSYIIDVQRNKRMVYKPLKELVKQVDIKIANSALHKINFIFKKNKS